MTSVAAERRVLPRGWLDLFKQVLIWFGFVLAYQVVRGIADRSPAIAFKNGRDVIDIERRVTGLWELSFQSWTESYELLGRLTSWTYWLSQFAVVGLALLPTAPPRMFPEVGFVDTLASMGTPNHGSTLVELASNPYAAMPSLHAADALIVGITLAILVRPIWLKILWLLWPMWVWFSVMATANHFWLDIAAGIAVALVAALVIHRRVVVRALAPAG
jgi:hypothetical protein